MSFTALELITRSYYLSQIVARDLQTPSGSQISDGLYLLNALLDVKGSDVRLIPYFSRYEFDTVVGQELYFIPGLLSIETMTFNMGVVRFQMDGMSRTDYFGSPRVDNIESLPFNWHAERVLDGMNIYLYFLPNDIYTVKLSGKFGLTNVTLSTDLSTIYDKYYIEYLRHALGEYICSDYAVNFPEQAAQKLKEIRKKLTDISPPDLTLHKTSSLQGMSAYGYNWGDVNFGKGWRPR